MCHVFYTELSMQDWTICEELFVCLFVCFPPPPAPPLAELAVRQGGIGLSLDAPTITTTLAESSLQSYHPGKGKRTVF